MSAALLFNLREISRLRMFRIGGGIAVALFLAGILGILVELFPEALHEQVVSLHYNIHFGIDAVGPWWRLFVPSAVALVVTTINVAVAARMWHREEVIAYAFLVSAFLVNIFVFLHIVFIVLLNLSV